jgi:WD40 repeat protein/serine/threonine protein kinase
MLDAPNDSLQGNTWPMRRSVAPLALRTEGLSPAEVVEAVCTDQQERWRRGERVPAEVYLYGSAGLEDNDAVLDVLLGELVLREERGEQPSLSEYQQRFPQYAEAFRLQVELHRALALPPCPPSPRAREQNFTTCIRGGSATPLSPPGGGGPTAGAWPTIPGYEILGELGRGGMGVVYKARQLHLKRLVALKMIRTTGPGDAEQQARFRVEAEAVARLQHPNIVQIYEVGEAEGRPFLALEYVEGGSLDRRLTGRPQPPRAAAELIETLAQTIHAAHQQGIVHRDLKPANILLQKKLTTDCTENTDNKKAEIHSSVPSVLSVVNLSPKITDFGLAKQLDSSLGHTQTGEILGTPSYMAPEQACGRLHEIGPAVDVYALGAILYQLLTGRPPFMAESPLDTLLLARTEEAVPPTRLQPRCPRDLETICLKCLQKDPRKRYASAWALAEDLQRFLRGVPIVARPISTWERCAKWARRRPAIAGLSAAVVGVTLLGMGLVCWQWQEAVTARQEALLLGAEEKRAKEAAQAAELREEEQRHRVEEALARSKKDLYIHLLTSAEREWLAQDATTAARLLEQCPSDMRQWEWYYLQRRFLGSLLTLPIIGDAVHVAFSPDGTRLAAGCRGKTVRVWDAHSGKELLCLKGHHGEVTCVAFSPDGRLLASASHDRTIKIWDAATGEQLSTLIGHKDWVLSIAFRPDGARLASGAGTWDNSSTWAGGEIKIWDVAGGREVGSLDGRFGAIFGVTFSPDGARLATAGFDGNGRIWDLAAGKELPGSRLAGGDDPMTSIAYSPDGKCLATGDLGKRVCLWAVEGGKQLLKLAGHKDGVTGVSFSPDSNRLASASWDQTVRVWDLVQGRELLTYVGHRARISCVAFSPDGEHLASGARDRTVKVWDAVHGTDNQRIADAHSQWITGACFSPDGQCLATSSGDKVLKIWNVHTRQVMLRLAGHTDEVRCVAYSPDGQLLASGSDDRTVRLWSTETGKLVQTMPGHTDEVVCVAFHPQGGQLASSCEDGRIKVWDVSTGAEVRTIEGRKAGVPTVCYSPDGKYLVSGSRDRTIRVWDAATGSEVRTIEGHTSQVMSLAISPDGARLASAAGDRDRTTVPCEVKVWDLATGRELLTISTGSTALWCVAFGRDGKRLVCSGDEGFLKVWDATDGRELLTLRGHGDDVRCIAFSPDGQLLATSGDEPTVRFWNAVP